MKVTKEQYNKWNAQAKNGFSLDLKHLIMWGEKNLIYQYTTLSGTIIVLTIEYRPEYETITNQYKCTYNKRTGRFIPSLIIEHWKPTGTGLYSTSGISKPEKIGEIQDKKKYNVLCKLSGEIDVESIINHELEKYSYLNIIRENKAV